MIFIPKMLQKLENGRHIGDLDPFAVFELFHHSVQNIEPSSENNMIPGYQFCALHQVLPCFEAKKNASEHPRFWEFRDVMVRWYRFVPERTVSDLFATLSREFREASHRPRLPRFARRRRD